jgi:hypothetical protein
VRVLKTKAWAPFRERDSFPLAAALAARDGEKMAIWNLTRTVMVVIPALMAGGLAVGCGGGGESTGDVTTGIAPSKLLSDVTAEEATSACERMNSGIEARLAHDELARASCTQFAVIFAETPEACEAQRDECIQQANSGSSEEEYSAEFDCAEVSDLSTCEGTVGQLETCVNDILDITEAAFDAFDCADAATITVENSEQHGGAASESPASCEPLQCADGPLMGG